jgi:L-gulonolactone oxidase
MSWRNWGRNQRAVPQLVLRPRTEEELSSVVAQAAASGRRIKVVGRGHSFSAIAVPEDIQLSMARMSAPLAYDAGTGRVTVQGGTTIAGMNRWLEPLGRALPNLGDIDEQRIAGAVATSTHGTGATRRGISAQVVGARVVRPDGSILDVAESDPLLPFVRVNLGALGVVSSLTVQTVPAFRLRATEAPLRVDEVLGRLDELVDETDFFEYYWVPHTRWTLTKRNQVTDEPAAPGSRAANWATRVLLENAAFGTLCRVSRAWPRTTPRLATVLPSTGSRTRIDESHRIFTSPRLVRFRESEWALPRDRAADALRAVMDIVARGRHLVSFPVEFRFGAADDIPMSLASGRDTAYVAVHMYRGVEHRRYFADVFAAMREMGGRPHWGKIHELVRDDLRPLYPRFDEFAAVRKRLDPRGTFSNAYLDGVLGPVE